MKRVFFFNFFCYIHIIDWIENFYLNKIKLFSLLEPPYIMVNPFIYVSIKLIIMVQLEDATLVSFTYKKSIWDKEIKNERCMRVRF